MIVYPCDNDSIAREINELLELAEFPFVAVIALDFDHPYQFHVRIVPIDDGYHPGWQDLVPEVLAFAWRDFEMLRPAGVRATYGIAGESLKEAA